MAWGRVGALLLLLSLLAAGCQEEAPPTPTPTAVSPTAVPSPPVTASPTATPRPGVAPPDLAFLYGGDLWLVPFSQDGAPVNLTADLNEEVVAFVWLLKGDEERAQRIAFAARRPDRLYDHYIMKADGTGRRLVATGPSGVWSTGGDYLAMVAEEEVVVVDSDGNIVSRLVFGPRPRPDVYPNDRRFYGSPAFAPAGRSLLAAASTLANMGASGNTSFYIYRVPLAGGTAQTLPKMERPIDGRLPYDLTFSPDGERIALTTSWHLSACATTFSLWVMDTDGGNRQRLLPPAIERATQGLGEAAIIISGYDWSPRSDAVVAAFQAIDCGHWRETGEMPVVAQGIYIMSVDGRRSEKVADVGEHPRWSPDGQRIAYTVGEGDTGEASVIHILELSSRRDRELAQGTDPAWQPLGRR